MQLHFPSKLHFFPILVFLVIALQACGPTATFVTAEQAIYEAATATKKERTRCNNVDDYIHSRFQDKVPTRIIRVNVHFMNSEDSTLTFKEERGTRYANDLIREANLLWQRNAKMKLPLGNETPVLPTRLQIQLTPDTNVAGDDGIYFHYDDSLSVYNSAEQHKTLFSNAQFKRYGRGKGQVINIFLMEHVPDSIGSPTYIDRNHGVGYQNWVKVIGTYTNNTRYYTTSEGDSVSFGPWFMARLLNHELGHASGLSHTWRTNDGCDDTPRNPNCWNYTKTGPCDSLVSNNLMDYNTYQSAVTPCQIGKLQYNYARPGSPQRKKLVRDFCTLDTAKNILLKSSDTIHISGYHDFYGNVTIERNTVVVVHCDITMPANSVITLKPNARLILSNASISNACGYKWQGIRSLGRGEKQGQLMLRGKAQIADAAKWANQP